MYNTCKRLHVKNIRMNIMKIIDLKVRQTLEGISVAGMAIKRRRGLKVHNLFWSTL
jgi:hypothetical protein